MEILLNKETSRLKGNVIVTVSGRQSFSLQKIKIILKIIIVIIIIIMTTGLNNYWKNYFCFSIIKITNKRRIQL